MSAELRAMRGDPFGQLQWLDEQLRTARMDTAAGEAQSWTGLGFRIGSTWLVAPRDDVREVIPPPTTTRVPNAQPWLRGLANVRGELLAVVDLAALLGLPDSAPNRTQRVLVFNSRRVPAGLLVDEVAGYRQFAAGEQRHEMVESAAPFTPFLLGALVREGHPWLVFSMNKLVNSDRFRTAAL